MPKPQNVTPEPNSAEVYEFQPDGGGPKYYLVYEPAGGIVIDRRDSPEAARLCAANWTANAQTFKSSIVGKNLLALAGLARRIAPAEKQQGERWELSWSAKGYVRANIPQPTPLVARPKLK